MVEWQRKVKIENIHRTIVYKCHGHIQNPDAKFSHISLGLSALHGRCQDEELHVVLQGAALPQVLFHPTENERLGKVQRGIPLPLAMRQREELCQMRRPSHCL